MKLFLSAFFTFLFFFGYTQEELSLFFHEDVLQSGSLQPANQPNSKFSIGFGSTYFHADIRGPKFVSVSGKVNYLENISEGLSENYLSSDASFNIFDLGFQYKDWYFRSGFNTNTYGYFNFSPEVAKILFEGNGNNIGKTFDFGPDLYIRQTSEFYIGASYPIYEYYRIGANLKLITGAFDISTPKSELSLTTGDEIYELTLENDYLINTSYNSLEFSLRQLLPFSNPFQDNIGISGDFGFQYLAENFDISANLLDVGFINWRSNTRNYSSEGKYTFDGFTFEDVNVDTLNYLVDTLQSIFEVEVDRNNYQGFTPLKIVIGGEYHIDSWHFGGILYGEWKQNRFLPAAGVNIRKRMWNFWDLGVSYAYKNNSYSNLGLSSVMNIGPVQLYALSDNVVGIFLPINRMKINFRVGGNINIGRYKKAKQAVPQNHTAALY